MIDKDIDSIVESDLQFLVDNEVGEKKSLEYKSTVSISTDSEKKEFLADISSFANSSGGDLIIGISESRESEKPYELTGLEIGDVDKYISIIENTIRDGIKPRIFGLSIRSILLQNGKHAIFIRVPNSWTSPHRVEYKGHDKFYRRNSNGKYPMDVDELRIAFSQSESIDRSIKEFLEQRVDQIYSGKTPIPIIPTCKVILHLLPISAFKSNPIFDIKSMDQYKIDLKPMLSGGWNCQYSIEGYIAYSREGSYTLVFRNGIIEAVTTDILSPRNGNYLIPSALFERMILESFQNYISLYTKLNFPTPIFIELSIVGIKNYFLATSEGMFWGNQIPYSRELLTLASGKLEKTNLNILEICQVFRPIFDSLWNAFGYKESPNFSTDGNWIRK